MFLQAAVDERTRPIDQLLEELDDAIAHKQQYQQQRQLLADSLRLMASITTGQERINLLKRLHYNYENFHADSTFMALDLLKQTPEYATDTALQMHVYLAEARAYGVKGLYSTALDMLNGLRQMLNNAPDALVAIKKSLAENVALQKQIEGFVQDRINNLKSTLLERAEELNGMKVATLTGNVMADVVRGVALAIKTDGAQRTAFLASTQDAGKPMLTVAFTDDLVKEGMKAGNVVKEAAKFIQGGGGGQPGLAQAGGRNPEGLGAAMDKMKELLG